MYSNKVKAIAKEIGLFFLEESDRDYDKAREQIIKLGISDLKILENGRISITLLRPGLLIGKRGSRIDALSKYIGNGVHIIEEEDPIIGYILPYGGDYESQIEETIEKI